MALLSVKASGMVTAVGFNAPASLAAIRAGISGIREVNLWDAESGEYISGAKVDLPHWWEGLGKFAELAAPAIHECLVSAQPVHAEEIPILLGVAAQDRPFRVNGLGDQLLDEIEHRLDLKHHPSSRIIPNDQVSVVVAMHEARRIIEQQIAPYCVVAGVDSFLSQRVIEVYMESRRVMTLSNSNGFFPGEAGSAVLIGSARAIDTNGELRILGLNIAEETATIKSEEPLRGEGLSAAVRNALSEAGLSLFDINYRITDLNGEHYKFKEAILVIAKLLRKRKEERFHIWHPIENLGEIGAAIGPCVLSMALHGGLKNYAPGITVLFHFSNDDGKRGAIIAEFSGGNA